MHFFKLAIFLLLSSGCLKDNVKPVNKKEVVLKKVEKTQSLSQRIQENKERIKKDFKGNDLKNRNALLERISKIKTGEFFFPLKISQVPDEIYERYSMSSKIHWVKIIDMNGDSEFEYIVHRTFREDAVKERKLFPLLHDAYCFLDSTYVERFCSMTGDGSIRRFTFMQLDESPDLEIFWSDLDTCGDGESASFQRLKTSDWKQELINIPFSYYALKESNKFKGLSTLFDDTDLNQLKWKTKKEQDQLTYLTSIDYCEGGLEPVLVVEYSKRAVKSKDNQFTYGTKNLEKFLRYRTLGEMKKTSEEVQYMRACEKSSECAIFSGMDLLAGEGCYSAVGYNKKYQKDFSLCKKGESCNEKLSVKCIKGMCEVTEAY